ncbi:hypothetical protein CKAN_01832000 [Cinnamomum micranthum f. kanehirae]|uniref:Uncharacterized protein n=1 Tax=Cinnamomum micranthum f. kanehirae TaxID=337451 RepID=A0A443PEU3_9MAGN|nr:hypothetical protein CKAN_01832000 [Cinnamomum micranthum f. kanehirae]
MQAEVDKKNHYSTAQVDRAISSSRLRQRFKKGIICFVSFQSSYEIQKAASSRDPSLLPSFLCVELSKIPFYSTAKYPLLQFRTSDIPKSRE